MKTKYAIALLAAAVLTGLVISGGCKKEPEPTMPPAEVNEAVADEPTNQTTCPVMGGAIDKTLFAEYKGKKVYFCCSICKGKFEADPEKYTAKLPQFAK